MQRTGCTAPLTADNSVKQPSVNSVRRVPLTSGSKGHPDGICQLVNAGLHGGAGCLIKEDVLRLGTHCKGPPGNRGDGSLADGGKLSGSMRERGALEGTIRAAYTTA